MAVLIGVDGSRTEHDLSSLPEQEQFAWLQNAVGGYVEVVPADTQVDGFDFIVLNEDGRLVGLPVNQYARPLCESMASRMFMRFAPVGPVVFCKAAEVGM